MSVSDAGEGRAIVRRRAVVWEGAEFTGRHRSVTGRPRKERRLTVRQKTAVVTDGAKRMKKRWMIHLQRD